MKATMKHPTKESLQHTRIGIPEERRDEIVALLNQTLVDLLDLHYQVKHAHWNVQGPAFIALHQLFDQLADRVEEHADDVAERITAFGGLANGTVRLAAEHSRLAEFPPVRASFEVVAALANHYGQLANDVRAAIDIADEFEDAGTADLFTGISRALDKDLWFLEAHLR